MGGTGSQPHLHRLISLLPYYLRTSGHHFQLRLGVLCNSTPSPSRELLIWPQDDPNSNDLTLTFFPFQPHLHRLGSLHPDYLLISGHLLQLKLSVLFDYPLIPPPNSHGYSCGDPFSTLSILSFFPFQPHLHRLGSLLPYYLGTSGHHL